MKLQGEYNCQQLELVLNPGLSTGWERSASICPVTTGDEDFITDLADLPCPGQAFS